MKIGILGSGNIGGTLARALSASGHAVKVANSRGPDTIDVGVLSTGAIAVTKEEALADVDVVILSIQFNLIPGLAPLLARLPAEAVVIDTSNHLYARDEKIEAIEKGQAESAWLAEQLGRPITKAWNTIYSATMKEGGRPSGDPERIAGPVAADRDRDRDVTWHWSRIRASTPIMQARWRIPGGSSAALRLIAPKSHVRNCPKYWPRPTWRVHGYGRVFSSQPMGSGTATPG